MTKHLCLYAVLVLLWTISTSVTAVEVIDSGFHHLRNAEPREWSHFPENAEGSTLESTFDLTVHEHHRLLTLRQADVKQAWTVMLNGKKMGNLDRDDSDLECAFPIPRGLLKASANKLVIRTSAKTPDDIRVGAIQLHAQTRDQLAREAEVSVSVNVPCRLTIVDAKSGSLVLLGAKSDDTMAVRAGVVYSLDGKARFGIRPGNYRIWAGRGFEYSLAKIEIEVKAGDRKDLLFELAREVPTDGLVACDTHLHTNEFARHGDATLIERLITIAGEGIELPISTEHDQHIDYLPEAKRIGADRYFTPVVGCEVTTQLGHFNSFPTTAEAKPAQHRLRQWPQIFASIFATPGVKVAILNHPRDLHAGFRPLDTFDVTTGRFTDGRELRANGIEVINSGAQQSDPMKLVHDWMALLNSGHQIAAVGSSDSHTVNFAIAGQARTYIGCPDDDPSNIDVNAAVDSVLAGKTHVSFGLLTRMKKQGDQVTIQVLGPSWSRAATLRLFANGKEIETIAIPERAANVPGLKFETTREIKHWEPGFVVAVAEGPGISEPWWRMMPPYQNDTSDYTPYVMGISPAVWLN